MPGNSMSKDQLKKESRKSQLEEDFNFQLCVNGIENYKRQYKFHQTRKWVFDFAFPDIKVAIEIDGGSWQEGKTGHTSGSGFKKDCIKLNEAARLGWKVFRFTSDMVKSGDAINYLVDNVHATRKEHACWGCNRPYPEL